MNKAGLLSAIVLAAAAASAQAAGPDDARIAATFVTANEVAVETGKVAEAKSVNAEVKKFAQQMVAEHTAVIRGAGDLIRKLKVKPEPSSMSAGFKRTGDNTLKRLNEVKGAAFDRAYIDSEVTYHQTLLYALDTALIPDVRNDELKALLVQVRPAFAAHLEHARKLQASLGK